MRKAARGGRLTSGNELNAHLEGWEKERRKHPFMAFDLNESTIEGCWEEASADYSGENYVMMIGDIIDSMVKRGILRDGDTVLDIGCGTGLFSIPIAGIATRVVCMDGSVGMLGRLEKQCREQGISNIETVGSSWKDFNTNERFDLVFSSLCPALNNPDSILRMASYSKRNCAYISSAFHEDGMEIDAWRRLGRDISFKGLDTRFPHGFLKINGMEPELEFFSSTSEHSCTVDEAESMLASRMGSHVHVSEEVREAISEAVNGRATDGMIVESRKLTLGLLTWRFLCRGYPYYR